MPLPAERSFLDYKITGLHKGFFIPDNFISEVQSFINRNVLTKEVDISGLQKNHVCPRCMKAHTIVSAKKMCLDSRVISFLEEKLRGEIGHDGYYLDGDKLVKI